VSRRKYIAGDIAYIPSGQKVTILDADIPGIYSAKAQRIDNGEILYVKPSDLAKRKAQALRKEPCLPLTPEIKEAAEMAAERKIERFLERKKKMENEKKLTFSEAKKYFDAIRDVENCNFQGEDVETVMILAKKGLYNMIKDGVAEG
jgi:hypothetical protein